MFPGKISAAWTRGGRKGAGRTILTAWTVVVGEAHRHESAGGVQRWRNRLLDSPTRHHCLSGPRFAAQKGGARRLERQALAIDLCRRHRGGDSLALGLPGAVRTRRSDLVDPRSPDRAGIAAPERPTSLGAGQPFPRYSRKKRLSGSPFSHIKLWQPPVAIRPLRVSRRKPNAQEGAHRADGARPTRRGANLRPARCSRTHRC